MNSVVLVGRLLADPRIVTTSAGDVGVFRLVVDRPIKGIDASDTPPDIFAVTLTGADAEKTASQLKRGMLVGIHGRITGVDLLADPAGIPLVAIAAHNLRLLGTRRPVAEVL